MKAEYSTAVMAAQGLYQLVDYAIIGGLAVENGLTTSFIIIQISFRLGVDSQNPPDYSSQLMLTMSLITASPINYRMSLNLVQK